MPIRVKLQQKLVYYSQAWSVVWDERPLFPEKIEAWANGPVVRDLYDLHRGSFEVMDWPRGDARHLDHDEQATVDAVLGFYGNKSAQWLSDLTHREQPWVNARRGLPDGERGSREISLSALEEYYSSIPAGD